MISDNKLSFTNLILTNTENLERLRSASLDLKLLPNFTNWLYIIILPLILITIIASLVGTERQNVGKAAGISSHLLVGITSASLAIMQRIMFMYLVSIDKADGSGGQRVIAQVVAGISFMGAGVVMKHQRTVRGLTTAATVWTVAMIGLILGSGYLILGSIAGFIVVAFLFIRDFSRKINPFKPTSSRKSLIKKYRIEDANKGVIDETPDAKRDEADDDSLFL